MTNDAITAIINLFAQFFGVKGQKGVFRLCSYPSYIEGSTVVLFMQRFVDGQWRDFGKVTERELRANIRPLVCVSSVSPYLEVLRLSDGVTLTELPGGYFLVEGGTLAGHAYKTPQGLKLYHANYEIVDHMSAHNPPYFKNIAEFLTDAGEGSREALRAKMRAENEVDARAWLAAVLGQNGGAQ